MTRALLLLILAVPLCAQDMPRWTTWEKAWVASSAALIGAQIADGATSYGNVGREQNPFFGTTFDGKDFAVKMIVAGGIIIVQHIVIRKDRRSKAAKIFTFVNVGGAGVTAFTAGRNYERTR